MYCRLKREYELRGWKLLSTGVIDHRDGSFRFLPLGLYRTLRLCDGTLHERNPFLTPEQRRQLRELESYGLIERVERQSPLEPRQNYKRYGNRFIHGAHWALTGRCNLRCRHCYMSAPHAKYSELPLEKCFDIIDQLAECGVRQLILSGGEALVRQDFLKIVDRIIERGMHIQALMSNGLLVNEKLLDEFEARGIRPEINMSYDGVDGCHDWMRGVDGAERAVLRAFALCLARGFPTGTEYCLHRGNIKALRPSVKRLAEFGLRSFKVNPLSPVGEGEVIRDNALSIAEIYETLLEYIPQYYADGAPIDLHLAGFFSAFRPAYYRIGCCKMPETIPSDDKCLCAHARNVMYITSEGRMLPCIPIAYTPIADEFPTFDEATLEETLTDSRYMKFADSKGRDYFRHRADCDQCRFRNRCGGGCRGQAIAYEMINGKSLDEWARDPYRCTFFRGGYYDRLQRLMSDLHIEQIEWER